jgi:hypothetical protein
MFSNKYVLFENPLHPGGRPPHLYEESYSYGLQKL